MQMNKERRYLHSHAEHGSEKKFLVALGGCKGLSVPAIKTDVFVFMFIKLKHEVHLFKDVKFVCNRVIFEIKRFDGLRID